MAKGKDWIAGAIKHPGSLRKALGTPKGKPIPAKQLAEAAKRHDAIGRKARLAETLRKMNRRRGG